MIRYVFTFLLGTCLSLIVLGCALADSSSEGARYMRGTSSSCRVGDAPRLHLERVPPGSGVKLESRVVIIGCGISPAGGGPVEIVGYRTSDGFCYSVDMPKLHRSEGGLCVPLSADWKAICGGKHVCANGAISVSAKGRSLTQASGQFDPRVKQLSVSEGVGSSTISVARVSPELKKQLGIRSSVAFFAAVAQGCSPSGIDLEWVEAGARKQLSIGRIAPGGCQG